MDSEQAKAGFSISNLLGFDRAQAEQPENSDNRHQLNLSENTGERERLFVRYFTQKFNILLHKTFSDISKVFIPTRKLKIKDAKNHRNRLNLSFWKTQIKNITNTHINRFGPP